MMINSEEAKKKTNRFYYDDKVDNVDCFFLGFVLGVIVSMIYMYLRS